MSASPRTRGRELAFYVLFQADQTGDGVNAVIARYQGLKEAKPDAAAFAESLATGAWARREELDAAVSGCASNWKLERLLSVDRAALRLGAYELFHERGTPVEVVLNECIELAKRHGSDESAAFVNGVLDRLAREARGDEVKKPKAPPARAAKAPREPKHIHGHAIPKRKVPKAP